MHSNEFFASLLRLSPPFYVADVAIQKDGTSTTRIDVFLGATTDVMPKKSGAVYLGLAGHEERSWQHLSVFNFPCYLHCTLPRFKFQHRETGKISFKTLRTPWSKANSEMTKDLEDWTLQLIEIHGNLASVSRQLGIQTGR
ncbi:MAG: transposase family protein [Saprospiraceae bacterium]